MSSSAWKSGHDGASVADPREPRRAAGKLFLVGCIVAALLVAVAFSRTMAFRSTHPAAVRPRAEERAEEPAYGLALPPRELAYDSLRNSSRLSDDELRWYFEGHMESEMAEVLDQDHDGIADGTRVELMEFIHRMKIILSDREPFEYRVTPQGVPIVRGTDL